MKTIVLYVVCAVMAVALAVLTAKNVRDGGTITEQAATIKEQRAMIERLAQQEAIAIHITNEFKSNAVLGKVVVDANVHNVAEQVASILKGELNGVEPTIRNKK